MAWLSTSGLDEKSIDGYSLVESEYPDETELIDGKLIVTYWYDDEINGEWSDVYIPKTGESILWTSYLMSMICLVHGAAYVVRFRRKQV